MFELLILELVFVALALIALVGGFFLGFGFLSIEHQDYVTGCLLVAAFATDIFAGRRFVKATEMQWDSLNGLVHVSGERFKNIFDYLPSIACLLSGGTWALHNGSKQLVLPSGGPLAVGVYVVAGCVIAIALLFVFRRERR